MFDVTVVGAGLAGSEAAWQLAERGFKVRLIEQRPQFTTPAHKTASFAELVCSNSLRAAGLSNAVGLLKEELRRFNSVIMRAADETKVEAGGALAVDREAFSALVTKLVSEHPNIEVINEKIESIPEGPVIMATGPLTEGVLAQNIAAFFGGREYMSFFDAAAPLVSYESVDMESAWFASRYGKGSDDYINCPMTEEEYKAFVRELALAQMAPVHGFEDSGVFEGCMPVETMARRGEDTLRFGPMKPIGLRDPKTGKLPYAVVQLRKDNAAGSVYNIVGFQTHLTFGEQKRVFSMIPALRNAEYLRYGVMHRNSFLCSPALLDGRFRTKKEPRVHFAGQFTGVEGYVESTASGLYAALSMAADLRGEEFVLLPPETAIGALANYISTARAEDFQPMNINFGLIPPLGRRVKGKREKNEQLAERSLAIIDAYIAGRYGEDTLEDNH